MPTDSLSRQALEAQAKDMAIEDALYALDKALQHGTITSEAYLKQVSHGAPATYMGCINAIECVLAQGGSLKPADQVMIVAWCCCRSTRHNGAQ